MYQSTFKKKNKKVIGLMLVLITSMLLLAACGNEEEQTDTTEDTRTIEHALGSTTIEGNPQRIVTLYQGATDVAVAFGIEPVGVVDSWSEDDYYDYLKDDLAGVPLVGKETQPNLEEISKLNPDLIIASQLRHEEVYQQLSEIAPTVAHETVFDFQGTIQLMGEALNQEDKANEILTNWDNRVADFKVKIEEKLGDEWPLNVSILNFRADHARIYFTGFAGSILADLGFTRPENQQKDEWGIQLTDKESIPEMNADVFYIFMTDDEAVKNTYNEWTNHPLWNNLDAVQNGQTYIVDDVIWNMAGGVKAANLMLDDIYDRFELEK